MLQIATPPIMAGHDAAHNASGFLCHEAEAWIAFEITLNGRARIDLPQAHTGGAPKKVNYGGMVRNRHLANA
jgi:hypothetical protein